MTADKLLDIARGELGVREFPPGSNNVKYNTAYYGRDISGETLAWCAVFVWWCFRQAGASDLYFSGGKTAYCPALMSRHRAQAVNSDYKPGDIIFFNFKGKSNAAHVGICESFDGTYITTIDGNTGAGSEANGGAVMRRRRHKQYIVGAYRPQYEEEIEMTKDEIKAIAKEAMAEYIKEMGQQAPTQPWQHNARQLAMDQDLTDGSRPMGLCTRVELWQTLLNAAASE